MKTSEKLILTNNNLLCISTRKVYFHPFDKSKLIKVLDKNQPRKWYKKITFWYLLTNENTKDRHEQEYIFRHRKLMPNNLPQYYGTVRTNHGTGLVFEYIPNSMDLSPYIKKNKITDMLIDAMEIAVSEILTYNIVLRDVRLNNFIVKTNNDGSIKFYYIEVGSTSHLPLQKLIVNYRQKKTIKMVKRFISLIEKNATDEEKEKVKRLHKLLP